MCINSYSKSIFRFDISLQYVLEFRIYCTRSCNFPSPTHWELNIYSLDIRLFILVEYHYMVLKMVLKCNAFFSSIKWSCVCQACIWLKTWSFLFFYRWPVSDFKVQMCFLMHSDIQTLKWLLLLLVLELYYILFIRFIASLNYHWIQSFGKAILIIWHQGNGSIL